MKISVASLGVEPTSTFIENVRLAEGLGFDGFFHNDAKWRRDVYVRLGAAAAATSRLRLGISVVDPYTRHPALTAQSSATLAEMAPGRFTTVMGAGSHFETLPGYSVRKPLTAMRESVALLRSLWGGEEVTIDGEIVKFAGGRLEFPPPTPPDLWIAGRGEKVLALAGEVADGVLMGSFATPTLIDYALSHVKKGLKQTQRTAADFTVASWLYVSVLKDKTDPVPDSVRIGVSYAFWSSREVLTGMLDDLASDVSDEFRAFLAAAPREWRADVMSELQRLVPRGVLDSLAVIGTADQVVEKLSALEAAGVMEAVVWPFPRDGTDVQQFLVEFADGPLQALGARD